MGTAHGEYEDFHAANRRAEVIDWLGGLLPVFDLPLDSSNEELREYLIDGTALCYIADRLMPGVLERSNVKKFLSVITEMGLPGFSVKDLEESLLRVVNGILDESIERKRGEIPHRVVYLLRNVVQEIEHRIYIQADHIRNQNSITKTREEEDCSKIKSLETLVNGTNEENEMGINRLELVKMSGLML